MAPQEFEKWLAILREHFPDKLDAYPTWHQLVTRKATTLITGLNRVDAAASSWFTVLIYYFGVTLVQFPQPSPISREPDAYMVADQKAKWPLFRL